MVAADEIGLPRLCRGCFMSKPVQSFMRMLKWGRKMCFYFYFGIFSAIFCWLVFAGLNIYVIHNIIDASLDNIVIAIISIILCNMLALALALNTSRTVYHFLGQYSICEEGIVIKYPLQKPAFFSWNRIAKIDACEILLGPTRKSAIRCRLTHSQDNSDLRPLEFYLHHAKSVLVFAYSDEQYTRMQQLWRGDGNG